MSSRMRLSGLISGMDTDSLISQLVEARKTKVDSAKKNQTKLTWKQDIWKDLNKKLKSLQTKYVANMRYSSAYAKKKVAVSAPTRATVVADSTATNSVQTLEVNEVAKTGYLTGAQISTKKEFTAMSTMKDLGWSGSGAGMISVNSGSGNVDISVSENTTISDVLTQLKKAGLNASFDATNQRMFVSAKTSGTEADFSITASDANGQAALAAMGIATDLSSDAATKAKYESLAGYVDTTITDKDARDAATLTAMKSVIDAEIADAVSNYSKTYESLLKDQEANDKKIADLTAEGLKSVAEYETDLTAAEDTVKLVESQIKELDKDASDYEDRKKTLDEQLEAAKKEVETVKGNKAKAESLDKANQTATELADKIADTLTFIEKDAGGDWVATNKLKTQAEQRNLNKANYAVDQLDKLSKGTLPKSGATKISGQNAKITLNGATFEGSTNVFSINGLTITALSKTADGEEITLTTTDDTDGIYDMVKNFLKEYNSIVNQMDKLYGAKAASKYEPLTSEEKEAMSEEEVKEWETKIKDSLLRSDSTLRSVNTGLQGVMSAMYEVNGKKMSLADFGIGTLSYFEAAENEKHAYHINGDPDDGETSGKEDKLKKMIATDPESVVSFFSSLAKSLYSKMSELSSAKDGYRTYGSFYDDKKMDKDVTSYNSKITDLEDKLNEYEDKMYDKFAKMESVMGKLQSSTNALAGLVGGSK